MAARQSVAAIVHVHVLEDVTLTPQWYLTNGGGFFAGLRHGPRLGEPAEDLFGEVAYLFGDEAGFSPAHTVGATHLALLAAVHLKSAMDNAARLHDLTEVARLQAGLNELHAYLTQTIQKMAEQVSNRTFPGLVNAPAATTALVRDSLSCAGSNGELVAGHLKEAVLALRPHCANSETDSQ